ncbi:MAG: hypothetical protein AAF661_12195 [Pseudomonadota bacterium]
MKLGGLGVLIVAVTVGAGWLLGKLPERMQGRVSFVGALVVCGDPIGLRAWVD